MDRKQRGRGAARGQGAARAREMGLLIDFSPGGMMVGSTADDDDVENDADLEAELLALTGGKPPGGRERPKGKVPLPMEHIERMAAMCMKDLDEEDGEDDEDLENDDDLLAELDDVLGEDDAPIPAKPIASQLISTPAASGSLESTVIERLDMYKTAITNAKQTGESSKVRRYERGLKTLESMLASVRKGKSINEEELPPPVALGTSRGAEETPEALQGTLVEPARNAAPCQQVNSHSSLPAEPPLPIRLPPAVLPKAKLPPPVPAKPVEPPVAIPTPAAPRPSSTSSGSQDSSTKALLLGRQREYKLAALNAKQKGDTEMATQYYRIAKGMDSILTALEQGETVDMGSLPPPPDQLPKQKLSPSPQHLVPSPTAVIPAGSAAPPGVSGIPPPPRDMLEAMQQRMDRYKTAAAQAKEKGDDRKARMHERIVKQYQDAIRSHKAGKTVDFSELPVPPGFPPLQGMEHPAGDQSIVGVLESAMKLAKQDDHDDDEEEDTEDTQKRGGHLVPGRPAPAVRPTHVSSNKSAQEATTPPGSAKPSPKVSTKAQQQLDFLEGRKKQLMQAALRAKQKNDMEGAKQFLRQAKGLDPMIEASQSGLPVDISKVPQAPVNAEDFTLAPRRGSNVTAKTTAQYTDLMELLKQQHEMCMSYSKQFTHLGNITETTKFEKMAADGKKNIEILKQAHAKGFPLPKFHYEERTFSIVKIFPDLNTNDMVLIVVKGINLPAPPGSSPNDLDSYVRFEFPYPNMEEAQRDKTNVIKNTNGPVFKEQFKLSINRGHRGLKRAIQAKGIKFEVIHKGGLFKQDRTLGTAQLKLDALETHCEIREIIELLDGRRPTGGKLEVIVRIREPLTSQQLDKVTEKWLVIEPLSMPPVALPKPKEKPPVMKEVGNRAGYTLQSLHVLAFERERLEKKIHHYKQMQSQPPNELLDQHRDIIQRFQWQKSHLEQAGPAARKEYVTQLERFLQLYTEAAQRLGHEGKRDAAKEALYKRNLVDNELQRFRR
ncbi:coiled-coil and C2 domain-containing protein 1A isoform X1 [Lissotriton helveticus]